MSKAAKSSPSPTAGGPLFGSLPKTPGFLRRNRGSTGGRRDDDDAGPFGTDSGASGGSGEDTSRNTSTMEPEAEQVMEESKASTGPFGTLSLQAALSMGSSQPQSSDAVPEEAADPEPDLSNQPRRGSEISTSSFSIAPSSPGGGVNHRNSLSSFASSTGSPLATGSSGGTTIGDLSTMSMPLLRGGEDRYMWNGSGTSQRSDGHSLAPSTSSRPFTGSTTSISDTSSVHSYPPAPAARPRTGTMGSRGSSVEGAESWRGWANTANGGKRRQSSDAWSYGADSSRSGGPRRGSNISFTMGSPPSRTTAMPVVIGNPFGPLRRRLSRSIGTGKSIAVELQLIVELVEALDHYIETFSIDSVVPGQQLPENGLEVINEVSTLVRELIEIAPDAQRCLHDGAYGPFHGTSANLSQLRLNALFDNGLVTWWPRRMERDCRILLDEVKFSTRSSASARAPSGNSANAEAGGGGGNQDVDGVAWTLNRLGGATDGEEGVPKEPIISAERREKLLDEGKRRWAAYRESQGLAIEEVDGPLSGPE